MFNCVLLLAFLLLSTELFPFSRAEEHGLFLEGASPSCPQMFVFIWGKDSSVLLWLVIATRLMITNEKFFWAGVLLGLAFQISYRILNSPTASVKGKVSGSHWPALESSDSFVNLYSMDWISRDEKLFGLTGQWRLFE